MKPALDEERSLYMQISEMIEDEILKGNINGGERVFSTNELAQIFKINPATAAKGINILVDDGILFKKRGIGMFVAEDAYGKIVEKRKKTFYNEYILKAVAEAEKLKITRQELVEMINREGGTN